MENINEKFFKAYWKPGMSSVYTEGVSKEMIASEVRKDGWYEWKLQRGTLTIEDYEKVETRFNVKFPERFIDWHKLYFFADGDCSIVRLPKSLPNAPLQEIILNLDWFVPEQIIPLGLIPFADEGNDAGPLVFDTRNQTDTKDFPIRVFDHEYGDDLSGLSEIIFSSFEKLLECLTYYLTETKTKQSFKVIPAFFEIDPSGAGDTGRSYWTSWIEMDKAHFEAYGR